MKRKHTRPANAGFTLVELMVVIAIIAMLATIVGINVLGALGQGSTTTAQAQISTMKTAVVTYRIQNKKMPSSLSDLAPFLDGGVVPKDPWDHDYIFKNEGNDFEIVSYGADGSPGGTEDNADISSKNLAGGAK